MQYIHFINQQTGKIAMVLVEATVADTG